MYHKLKYDIEDLLKDLGLKVYSLKLLNEYGNNILQILVDKDTPINLLDLEKANNLISNFLDNYPSFDLENYFLEVSSVGAEKELLTKEDIINSISKYVHVLTSSNTIFEGYLEEVNDLDLVLSINVKGRIKKQTINFNDIKLIRLAVKI